MNDFRPLQSLADQYPVADGSELDNLASQYEQRQQQEILDVAAVATDVSTDSILNLGLEPKSDPLLAAAFRLQYPNVAPDSLSGATEETLLGFANGIKGKYFEILVADRLNRGMSLGELTLGSGQFAEIADSPTQAGWDLKVVDGNDGSVVDVLQLKATESMGYVKSALARYPGIRVAVPLEIDGVADEILQTDILDSELEEAVNRYVGELSEDTIIDVLNQGGEWAFDTVPIVPAILIAATEGKSLLVGRSSVENALQRSARRLGKAAIFSTLGATLIALHSGLLSVPVTVAARLAWSRIANRSAIGELLELRVRQMQVVTADQTVGD